MVLADLASSVPYIHGEGKRVLRHSLRAAASRFPCVLGRYVDEPMFVGWPLDPRRKRLSVTMRLTETGRNGRGRV